MNALRGKPDRLLIEPTGLGHPKQILDMLTSAVYEPYIDLRATRFACSTRVSCWMKNMSPMTISATNWRRQNIIVANKQDRSDAASLAALNAWRDEYAADRELVFATQGEIDPALLDKPRLSLRELPASAHHAHSHATRSGLAALSLPGNQRWRRSLNLASPGASRLRLDFRCRYGVRYYRHTGVGAAGTG